jgi:hypothetical protein
MTEEQFTDLLTAVEDAHAITNRRRTPRFRHVCNAEMSPWENDRAGTAFGVVLEDFSTTGVGIRHTARLKAGGQYLLEVPRPGTTPLTALLTVVRCDETAGGWFEVELAPDDVLEVANTTGPRRPKQRSSGGALKLALILVAFAASASAMFFMIL